MRAFTCGGSAASFVFFDNTRVPALRLGAGLRLGRPRC